MSARKVISCLPWSRTSGVIGTESRMFVPALGIREDAVSGNAHGMLGVYLVNHGLMTPERGSRRVPGPPGHVDAPPGHGRSGNRIVRQGRAVGPHRRRRGHLVRGRRFRLEASAAHSPYAGRAANPGNSRHFEVSGPFRPCLPGLRADRGYGRPSSAGPGSKLPASPVNFLSHTTTSADFRLECPPFAWAPWLGTAQRLPFATGMAWISSRIRARPTTHKPIAPELVTEL